MGKNKVDILALREELSKLHLVFPVSLAFEKDLPPRAIALYAIMKHLDSVGIHLTYEELARLTDIQMNTIRKLIKKLEENGSLEGSKHGLNDKKVNARSYKFNL